MEFHEKLQELRKSRGLTQEELAGVIDLFYFLLIVLPLYPKSMDGFISSVNLIAYTETTAFNRMIYWGMFLALIVIGMLEIALVQLKITKAHKIQLAASMSLSIFAVLFLALTGETYATALAFLLFILKVFLSIKGKKKGITDN